MDNASLNELLRAAGRCEAPPEVPCDLAERVRRLRIHRRRTRRAMGGMAALVVLLLGIVWTVYRPARQVRTVEDSVAERTVPSEAVQELPGVDVDRLRAEIAALSAEADARQQIVDELIARQRYREQIARLDEDLARPDPLEIARIESEKTAFLLVDYAQQQSPLLPDSPAADEYRRVLKHFPGTNAARTAEMRLNELSTK